MIWEAVARRRAHMADSHFEHKAQRPCSTEGKSLEVTERAYGDWEVFETPQFGLPTLSSLAKFQTDRHSSGLSQVKAIVEEHLADAPI